MRKLLIKLSLTCITFTVGVAAAKIWRALYNTTVGQSASIPSPSLSSTVEAVQKETYIEPKELSPYEIRNFINAHPQGDLRVLWQRLGIKTINASNSQKLDPDKYHFLTTCANCKAESFEYDLDGEAGNEIMVRIQDGVYEACRYLVFKFVDEPVSHWKLLGHIDEMMNKYRMSQHSVILSGGRSWLIINGQGASGSGIALYVSRVFLISPHGLKEIFVYMAEGHQGGVGDDPERDFFGTVLSCEIHDGVATAEIEFAVKYYVDDYSNHNHGILLFAKTQKAVFIRRLRGGEEKLDSTRSELSEHELEDVYYIDSLSNEDFLKYNYAELSRITTGKDAKRKDWLRRFLTQCDETPEHRHFQKLLEE